MKSFNKPAKTFAEQIELLKARGMQFANEQDARWKLSNFLCDLTTSYYADEIIKWIETKVAIRTEFGY